MRTRPIHTARCGDHIREIDGRHIGRVSSRLAANGRALFLTILWLDSGWISENLDVRGLEFVPAGEL